MDSLFRILVLLLLMAALALGILLLISWTMDLSVGWLPFLNSNGTTEPTIESFVSDPNSSSGPTVNVTYQWTYTQKGGWLSGTKTYPVSLTVGLPEDLYLWYKGLERAPTSNYSVYVTNTDDDGLLQTIASELGRQARENGFTTDDALIGFAASFVQCGGGMQYLPEGEEGEYPKYPIETLYERGGDCEDTSVLLAEILKLMGRDAILVNFPPPDDESAGHMGVGVTGSFTEKTHYSYEGKDYYYIETTNNTYAIGVIPDDYKDRTATLYELEPLSVVKFYGQYSWEVVDNIVRNTRDVTLHMTVRNWGTASAEDVSVQASYDGQHWETSADFDLQAEYQASDIQVELTVPEAQDTIKVQLVDDGVIQDEAEADLEMTS